MGNVSAKTICYKKKEAFHARKRYQKNCQRTTKKEASELEADISYDNRHF